MKLSQLIVMCGVLGAAGVAAAQEGQPIVKIDVVENSKTNDETVILIADVEVGDTFSYELLERVRTDLVSSGLFKDVQVIGMPDEKGVRLTIVAKDKHSWVIAPTVYLQPGNKGGGLGFAENNLFGANKKLLLYGQIATSDSLFIAGYLDPSFLNSPIYFRADVFVRHEEVTEYSGSSTLDEPLPDRITPLKYYNAGFLFGVNLWKGFSLDARLRGAAVDFGDADCADTAPEGSTCEDRPGEKGADISTEGKITYDKRANWYGVTRGTMFGLSFEKGLPELGSDFDYWLASVRYQKAIKYWEEHNLIIKLGGAVGHHLPFQQELTSGGTNLRGYQNRQFRGDTKASGTVEYSVPLFKIGPLAFRGLAFTDLAYTTFTGDEGNDKRHYLVGQTDVDTDSLRVGVGGGFRIYVRSIVLPLLGVDWGYAPQSNEARIYFAVGLTEL